MKKLFLLILIFLVFACIAAPAALASYNTDVERPADYYYPEYSEREYTAEEKRNIHIGAAVVSLALAFGIPGIVVAVWTSKLKSVRPKDFACEYIRQGSMILSLRRDTFLYRNVTKIAKPQNNNNK